MSSKCAPFASGDRALQAVAGGALDFGLADFTAAAFTLAGQGAIKAIAAQARERRGYEGNGVIASNAAFAHGLTGFAGLANKTVAISALGAPAHISSARSRAATASRSTASS